MEVVGDSMQPTLREGDRLVLLRTPRARAAPQSGRYRARPGQLVAVRDPRHPDRTVIKRVAATSDTGVTLLGDNPDASTDSRTFGTVGWAAVEGRAVYRYFPAERRGGLVP